MRKLYLTLAILLISLMTVALFGTIGVSANSGSTSNDSYNTQPRPNYPDSKQSGYYNRHFVYPNYGYGRYFASPYYGYNRYFAYPYYGRYFATPYYATPYYGYGWNSLYVTPWWWR